MPARPLSLLRQLWRAQAIMLLVAATIALEAAQPANGPSTQAVSADHSRQMARGLELFKEHIGPLLAEHCIKCHGGEKTKGELDLTTREALLKGGADGPAIVVGKSGQSRLV